jgi:hypothetical protein
MIVIVYEHTTLCYVFPSNYSWHDIWKFLEERYTHVELNELWWYSVGSNMHINMGY